MCLDFELTKNKQRDQVKIKTCFVTFVDQIVKIIICNLCITKGIFITLAASNRGGGGGKDKSKCEKCEGVDIDSVPFKIFVEDSGVLSLMINKRAERHQFVCNMPPSQNVFVFLKKVPFLRKFWSRKGIFKKENLKI